MIQFIDLAAQQARLRRAIDARIAHVLDHGQYIMGPEVAELETRLAGFCGAAHCITCANGTDALQLALMALKVGPGDAVFVPSFTFAASAEVVPAVGATPVFVDIDRDTYTMSAESLERTVGAARKLGLKPAVAMPVDLFGLSADYDALGEIAARNGLRIVADSAQGFGAEYKGRRTGSLGDIATTSFFPAKPLGCYGDGGALFTGDAEIAELLDSLRVHGKGAEKYDNVRIGVNSRLDTLQAAILLEKLAIYGEEIEARQEVAGRYTEALAERFSVPVVPDGYSSVWAQYTLRASDSSTRQRTMMALKNAGIPSVIYYPRPLHLQTAYRDFPRDPEGLPNSEASAERVFSIPMSPYLRGMDQERVISALNESWLKE